MSNRINVEMWKRWDIRLGIRNRLTGGIPTNPELIKGWIAANIPDVSKEEQEKLAEKTSAELGAATEERAEGMWTTFKKDESGIYVEGRQLKAMFKECSNILREMLIKTEKKAAEANGTKNRFTNLKSKVAERLFVEQDKVFLLRDGKALLKPDGSEEKAIHVMTPQGPRDALKRVDFVNAPVELRFTIRQLNDGVVDEALIRTLLEFGGWNGLGADRSQGSGLFDVVEMQAV